MAPSSRRLEKCQVCKSSDSKYTCAQCSIIYCSVPCYKIHKENAEESCKSKEDVMDVEDETLEEQNPLRPLTSVRWPYVPDESAYPDPLKRDDPKVLQLRQYESIATSPAIRKILANQNLRELMISVDKLRGREREQALQKALGVTPPQIDDQMHSAEPSEEVLAFENLPKLLKWL
ncbi:hypothetical protein BDQ17DRAFT_1515996 [Cyathus striatus]|nr:hypothetical protein BDQ17DRAFT_1515996 [Cyathus striatus]